MRYATRFLSVLLAVLLVPLLAVGCDFIFSGGDGDGGDGGGEIALTDHSISPSFVDIQMPGVEAFTMISSEDTLAGAPDFTFGGSPDGAGLLKSNDGTYTYVTNNEDNDSIARLALDETFKPIAGEYIVDSDEGRWRLCSGTLITPEEHGFGPGFFSAGESGEESQIHYVDPLRAGPPRRRDA